MRIPLLPLALAALAGPVAAQTVVVDFDDYPGPDGILGTPDDVPIVAPTTFAAQGLQLTDQFASVGVQFVPNPSVNDKNEILDAASFATPASHTPPNLLASSGAATITGAFTHPVYTVSALIGISGGSDELEIFDAAGASLGAVVGDDVVVTLSSAVPIATFEVRPVASTTPAIDNLEFDAGASGPSISVAAGAPGGSMTFDFSGFTPNGTIAVVYGPAATFTVPSGTTCGGLVLDLIPLLFPGPTAVLLFVADANGDAQYTRLVSSGAAGFSVQAVDVTLCATSNAIVL